MSNIINACLHCQTPATYGLPNYLDADGNVICPDCAHKDPDIYTGYLDKKRARLAKKTRKEQA